MKFPATRHLQWNRFEVARVFFNAYVLIYILVVYIYASQRGANPSVHRIVAFPLFLLGVFYILATNMKIAFGWFEKCLLLFLVACLVSTCFAINQAYALQKCRTVTLILLLVVLLHTRFRGTREVPFLLFLLCLGGIGIGVYIVSYFGIQKYIAWMYGGMRTGRVINSNIISMYTAYAAILGFWYAYYKKKTAFYFVWMFCAFVCLASGSKKGFIALFLGTLGLLVAKGKRKKIRKAFLCAIVVSGITYCLMQLDLFTTIAGRMVIFLNEFLGDDSMDRSTFERIAMIRVGMEIFLDAPFVGIGIGNSRCIAKEYIGFDTYLHNNYIELLASVGLIGTIPFYAMWLYPLWKLIHLARRGDDEAIVITLLLSVELFLHVGYVAYTSIPAYLLLLVAYVKLDCSGKNGRNEKSGTECGG